MPYSAQRDEGGWRGKRGAGERWDQFDALPRGVKRLYWEAPYQYTALPAFEAMVAGVNLRRATEVQRDSMRRDVAREARAIYGPTHPQARGGQWL